ncbi:hypothetical protein C5167_033626 [Papaver somniferum]|uniref:Uncharacterized protein n=1 Tax=Papaver somniferum TaxID=3469 RepID=A0A4Y7KEL7_PAPSO|nr:hypothetical protein C5167_033626 [Papaver somniferum]
MEIIMVMMGTIDDNGKHDGGDFVCLVEVYDLGRHRKSVCPVHAG